MKIGPVIILPWDRKNFLPRVVAIGLVLAWVWWGITIYQEGRLLKAQKQARIEQLKHQEEQQRRRIAYEQYLLQQQQEREQSVQSSIDVRAPRKKGERL